MATSTPRAIQSMSRHICTSCRRQLLHSRTQPASAHTTRIQRTSQRAFTAASTRLFSNPSSPSPPHSTSSSVSQDEITHFNALASSWWDPYGPSRLLHLMNPLRHDFIRRCRSSHPTSSPTLPYTPSQQRDAGTGLSYLDIGCGGGIFAESAARLPDTRQVIAIDPSSEVLAVAKLHARKDPLLLEPGRLTYLNTTIEDLGGHLGQLASGQQGQQKQVDLVSIFEVIEHVPYPSSFLEHIMPYVKPGGWLIGSTISRTWTSWLTTKVVAEDIVGLVPRGTHDWDKYINPDELRKFFAGIDTAKHGQWGKLVVQEVMYVPGFGWKEVPGIEGVGNYFFGIKREA